MTGNRLYDLRDVKRFVGNARTILDIPRLDVIEGSLTAVVGPNGAGKSTLLATLAFLERPDEGEIRFQGVPVCPKGIHAVRHRVTMVAQAPLLFQGTVTRNVAYGLKVRGVPRSRWGELVGEALAMVDLAGFENRSVRGLSGGETQRVAIARAIVFGPEVLLLDEPTSNVDAARVELIEELIRGLNRMNGMTVVFSTHNLAQAWRLTERVICLAEGKTADAGMANLLGGSVETRAGIPCPEV